MRDQYRYEPYERSTFFADRQSSRQPVANTVARGQLRPDAQLTTGKDGDQLVNELPFPATREVLERGQQRYNVFCAPCHGLSGNGNGVVVQRGFPAPPSLHQDRLRDAPVGHYFDVITNGFGRMYPYDYRIPVEDRWAIVAYIRALQLSQNAQIEDVPPEERQQLQGAP
ncbi:MAG TPA: cytochrome c [Herpetosiphonaceae bacterium]